MKNNLFCLSLFASGFCLQTATYLPTGSRQTAIFSSPFIVFIFYLENLYLNYIMSGKLKNWTPKKTADFL